MSSLYILIPVTLLLLLGAVVTFLWAVNNDQFDDIEQHASRILFDDDEKATMDAIRREKEQHSSNRQGDEVDD